MFQRKKAPYVPVTRRSWSQPYNLYFPMVHTSKRVIEEWNSNGKNGWADNPDPALIDFSVSNRQSYCTESESNRVVDLTSAGAPLNPLGRTGTIQRGSLGRWGVNNKLVLAVQRKSRVDAMEILLVKNIKSGLWELPSGYASLNRTALADLKLLLLGHLLSDQPQPVQRVIKAEVDWMLEQIIDRDIEQLGQIRNSRRWPCTDHAWVEATLFHARTNEIEGYSCLDIPSLNQSSIQWTSLTSTFVPVDPEHKQYLSRVRQLNRASARSRLAEGYLCLIFIACVVLGCIGWLIPQSPVQKRFSVKGL